LVEDVGFNLHHTPYTIQLLCLLYYRYNLFDSK
jgi:hypothetical protein